LGNPFLLAFQPVDHLFGDRGLGHQEQSGCAFSNLVAGLLDEFIADAEIGQVPGQAAHQSANGYSENRDEEDQAKQPSLEGTL
jgi:hypothetical protein